MPEAVLIYDGACPFCSREAHHLRRADRDARVCFVDIHHPDFDPSEYGLTRDEVDARLHFFDETGRLWRGMDAVRAVYRSAGIGGHMAWTGVPILRPVFDRLYLVFARHRLRWGRWLANGIRVKRKRS